MSRAYRLEFPLPDLSEGGPSACEDLGLLFTTVGFTEPGM